MQKTCTFLGNSDIRETDALNSKIRQAITDLITNKGVNTFYVGIKGQFETLCHRIVSDIKQTYPDIQVILIIAYVKDLEKCRYPFDDFYFPVLCEFGYKGWSIAKRNEWLINETDYIISYNRYQGRAYNYCQKARRKKKEVMEISDNPYL